MKKSISIAIIVIMFAVSFVSIAMAQQKPPDAEKVVVKVQVVLSRYEGDRRVSSLPYTMLATADSSAVSVRTGSQVAVAQGSVGADGKSTPNWQYINVGTNIDCNVKPEGSRFNVHINVNDSSYIDRQPGAARATTLDVPTLRNFSYGNSIILKDGETKQFVAASDKVSGDVVKIDVTLNVEK